MIDTVIFFAIACTSHVWGNPGIDHDRHCGWFLRAGRFEVHYDQVTTLGCDGARECLGLRVEATYEKGTCLRFRHPHLVLRDGSFYAPRITEEGTPGEPGWKWRADFPPVYEPFFFEVETYDACELVS